MKKIGLAIAISILTLVLTACPPTQAAPEEITFTATLNGAAEVPANVSQATGAVTAVLKGDKLTITGTYTGLAGAPTGAHIHGPAATGANAGVVVAITTTAGAAPTAGTISGSFTLSAAQIADLKASMYYINVHTSKYGSGEIRGQLTK